MMTLIRRSMVAAALVLSVPAVALAGNGHDCSASTLRGRYVFSATGFNIVAGVPQPKAIIEVIDFNGDGTLVVSGGTKSLNGVITGNLRDNGTYDVSEDCSGTLHFGGPAFDIFVSPSGDELWLILTNPTNNVFLGTAKRTVRRPNSGDRD